MSRLLQISDTHFGTEQPPVLEALLTFAREHAPDALVLSGDITQRATTRQFAAARRLVEQLAIPHRLVIPGNHDIPLFNLWRRMHAPYARFREAFGPDLEPILDTSDWLIVGVNTTRAWRHKDGDVSDRQILRVSEQLQRAQPGQLRIVVTHQPAQVARQRDAHNLLHGHDAALQSWIAAGADIVMGGHIHLPYVCALHDAYPNLRRRAWCVQAGTAISRRIRREAPNSVNLIHYSATGGEAKAQLERWDFQATCGRFQQVSVHALSLDHATQPRSRHEAEPRPR